MSINMKTALKEVIELLSNLSSLDKEYVDSVATEVNSNVSCPNSILDLVDSNDPRFVYEDIANYLKGFLNRYEK